MHKLVKNEIGNRYGKLIVVLRSGSKYGKALWLCKCDCGNETVVSGVDLRLGITKSCGCYRSDVLQIRNRTDKQKKAVIETRKKEVGPKNHMYGKKRPEHSKRMSGKNSPFFNHNLTDEERINNKHRTYIIGYREWRKSVLERDDYTCQCCGIRGGKLHSHHIESYNNHKDLRTSIDNGITLCKTCHKNFHHQYGRGDNTRKQFEEFLKGGI